jgi:phosphomannomutase
VDCGLAVDGDGDRIAVIDRNAVYYDANQILLLLIHYLVRYRSLTGKVVVSFSTTSKIEKLCQEYGLEVIRARVGFKDITRIMMEEQVLIAGEESGGIAFGSHIPERDAIWAGMMLWEWLEESKRPLHELYDEVIQVTGPFFYERAVLDVSRQARNRCMELLAGGRIMKFGMFRASRYEVFDGVKFFFGNDWLMFRASGTEPLLRLYAESDNPGTARELIQEGLQTLSGPAEPSLPLH